ncbi:ABC transporter permease [Plantactinospora sp. S1510]|uniref:ABC transporter permease n=1 Tax=Plantactinospora alkalitolerans TaxID=2789879 RepID=A0ABS0H2U5_9ACTN|nr:ABC transporter permease [Plantactinospora alkalitolerans]MBF9132459.1 ABC transporter permease [Plantactinospora alkalitolerans]
MTVHAEWTKLRTLPSTTWLGLTVLVATVAFSALATLAVDTSQCPTPTECFEDTTRVSLWGVRVAQVAVAVLAVLAVTNEYGNGLIQTTLAANPRRWTVLAAKAAVVTALVLAAAVPGVLGSLLAGRFILPGNGFAPANGYPPLSLADEPTLRAAVGTVLYLGLVALLAIGVGTAVRDTAGAMIVVFTLLFSFPVVTQLVSDPKWQERLEKVAPMTSGLAVQATTALERQPIGPWAGLGVLAGWAGAALLVGALLFRFRDA